MTVAMVWCVNVTCVSTHVTLGVCMFPYKYTNAAMVMYIFVNSLSLCLQANNQICSLIRQIIVSLLH